MKPDDGSPAPDTETTRAELDAARGPLLVEFGSRWCGWCRAAQPLIAAALDNHPTVRHIRIEDGPGQPLGRSYRVKLWPTLVFLGNGDELERLVRPDDVVAIERALTRIDTVGP